MDWTGLLKISLKNASDCAAQIPFHPPESDNLGLKGQQVTLEVTRASPWKPHVFNPAVTQEAAQDPRLFVAERPGASDVLLRPLRLLSVDCRCWLLTPVRTFQGVNPVQARGALLTGDTRKISVLPYVNHLFSSGEDL